MFPRWEERARDFDALPERLGARRVVDGRRQRLRGRHLLAHRSRVRHGQRPGVRLSPARSPARARARDPALAGAPLAPRARRVPRPARDERRGRPADARARRRAHHAVARVARPVLPGRLLLDGALPLRRAVAVLRALHRRGLPRTLQVRQARRTRGRGAGRRARRGAGTRRSTTARSRPSTTQRSGARRARGRRDREEHDRGRHGRPRRDPVRPRARSGARRSPLRRRGDARAARHRRSAVLAAQAPRAPHASGHRARRGPGADPLRADGRGASGGPRRAVARAGARRAAARARARLRRDRALVHRGHPGAAAASCACPTPASRGSPRSTRGTATSSCSRRRCAPDDRGQAPHGARRSLQARLRPDAHGGALDALRHPGRSRRGARRRRGSPGRGRAPAGRALDAGCGATRR